MSGELLIEKAKLAEMAERYEDMAKAMKEFVQLGEKLQPEARNLLSVAYKNVVGTRRSSWRVLAGYLERASDTDREAAVKDYMKIVGKEMKEICDEVVNMLDEHLIKSTDNEAEGKVFYLKMKGDYFRYMCEVESGDARKALVDKAGEIYGEAESVAAEMEPTHPIRLGLALNNSVFFYEIVNKPEEAAKLAKTAVDNAMEKLDPDSPNYGDSTVIIQLLKDNLNLWTADGQEKEDTDDD